jgi:hypothetical protein
MNELRQRTMHKFAYCGHVLLELALQLFQLLDVTTLMHVRAQKKWLGESMGISCRRRSAQTHHEFIELDVDVHADEIGLSRSTASIHLRVRRDREQRDARSV